MAGGYKFEEFIVDFNVNAHIRPDLSPEIRAWATRGEGDHVKDYLAWGGGAGKRTAQEREDRYKKYVFSSREECESLTSESLHNALQFGIEGARRSTVRYWDESGRHTYGGPNQRP